MEHLAEVVVVTAEGRGLGKGWGLGLAGGAKGRVGTVEAGETPGLHPEGFSTEWAEQHLLLAVGLADAVVTDWGQAQVFQGCVTDAAF